MPSAADGSRGSRPWAAPALEDVWPPLPASSIEAAVRRRGNLVSVMIALASRVDLIAQRLLGMPYLKLTRGYDIHDRCRYLLHLIGETPQPPQLEILDVGCGSGLVLRHLERQARPRVKRYLGID